MSPPAGGSSTSALVKIELVLVPGPGHPRLKSGLCFSSVGEARAVVLGDKMGKLEFLLGAGASSTGCFQT